jgi:hypothetical protein
LIDWGKKHRSVEGNAKNDNRRGGETVLLQIAAHPIGVPNRLDDESCHKESFPGNTDKMTVTKSMKVHQMMTASAYGRSSRSLVK